MNWHADPSHWWVALYRIFVIVAILVGLWLQLDVSGITRETNTEVKGIQVELEQRGE
jgi:hypothetical protein